MLCIFCYLNILTLQKICFDRHRTKAPIFLLSLFLLVELQNHWWTPLFRDSKCLLFVKKRYIIKKNWNIYIAMVSWPICLKPIMPQTHLSHQTKGLKLASCWLLKPGCIFSSTAPPFEYTFDSAQCNMLNGRNLIYIYKK